MLKFLKQNYDVIWKSFVGSIVMFYFVRFLHLSLGYFFLAIAAYILLFFIAMAIALHYKGAKPAWFVIISFVFGMTGHVMYYKHTCGSNSADVKVMKSLGNAINRYLTTKGKPSSLDSIPDLPYELKCGSAYSCTFEKGGRRYRVWLEEQVGSYYLELYFDKNKTGILYTYDEFKEKKFVLRKPTNRYPSPHIYSRKRTGICSPMSQ